MVFIVFSLYLLVLLKPNVTALPSNSITAGDNLLLSCNVQSSKQPIFKWYKDNQLIISSTPSTSFLYIPTSKTTDGGKFYCKCETNIGGVAVSNELQVNVAGKLNIAYQIIDCRLYTES